MIRFSLFSLFVISLACLATTAHGQQVADLSPVRDNTLFESATGALSNGAGSHLFAGTTNQGQTRRALLAFDVAGALPAGIRIDSVRLTMNMSRSLLPSSTPVALHRVLADWGEGASDASGEEGQGAPAAAGDATWVHRFSDTDTWQAAGGDFEATASATRSVGGTGRYSWPSTARLTADVQGWLDQPETNFGWMLMGDEAASPTAKRFDSREHPQAANRPVLTVYYSNTVAKEAGAELPAVVEVLERYPNPFAASTALTYALSEPRHVVLAVYDALGRRVRTLVDGWQVPGTHRAVFDAADLPSGTYLYRLEAGATVVGGELVLVR